MYYLYTFKPFVFIWIIRKKRYSFSYYLFSFTLLFIFVPFCSSLFYFVIWYQSSDHQELCLLHLFMGEVDDPSQDLSSPYHVSSSDNPSFLIVSIILEGPNYHHWSRSFQISLISKNKIGFIDGTIVAPNRTKSLFATWQRANMLVVLWILKAVSQSIAQSIICMDNAFDIWNDLKERFS